MNNLTKILGPAPSELDPEAHLILVKKNRARVSSTLQAFRDGPSKKGKGGRKKKRTLKLSEIAKGNVPPEVLEEMQRLGVSFEELNAALEGREK